MIGRPLDDPRTAAPGSGASLAFLLKGHAPVVLRF
jgi:hypothetical protein